jgi:hypothetical protein
MALHLAWMLVAGLHVQTGAMGLSALQLAPRASFSCRSALSPIMAEEDEEDAPPQPPPPPAAKRPVSSRIADELDRGGFVAYGWVSKEMETSFDALKAEDTYLVDRDTFGELMARVGEACDEAELDALFAEADGNSDGMVDFAGWCKMIMDRAKAEKKARGGEKKFFGLF